MSLRRLFRGRAFARSVIFQYGSFVNFDQGTDDCDKESKYTVIASGTFASATGLDNKEAKFPRLNFLVTLSRYGRFVRVCAGQI